MPRNRPKPTANTQHEALVRSGFFARRGRLAPSREGVAQAFSLMHGEAAGAVLRGVPVHA